MDRYSLRSVLVVVFTVVLSIIDAALTLELVSHGAKELNPVMNFFLSYGPYPFLVVKYLITGVCLVVFLIHKNYSVFGGRVSVKNLLIIVLVTYVVLIGYELVLLMKAEAVEEHAKLHSGMGGTPLSNSVIASSKVI